MEKKKLLITGSAFPRWKGDTEPRYVFDYADAIAEYYDVTVLTPASPEAKDRETMSKVNVIRYHYFPIHKWETLCHPGAMVSRIKEKKIRIFLVPFLFFALYFQLKKLLPQYDVVHVHGLIPQGIVQSFFNKPYIVTGHGGDVTSLNYGFWKNLKKKALKNAEHVTVVSEALKEYIQNIYPNDKTSVIPMGCDISLFSTTHYVRNYFGQGNKRVILFVGRLAEKKGVQYLIEAMKNVNDAILYIVGKGNLETELKKQAQVPELEGKVVFLGPKTHKELSQIYASSDVFVAPSITASDGDKEGFGLVILEAMASGLPVVASNSGGIPDIITDEWNGLLCTEKAVDELSNAINRILDDEELRKKLVINGIKTAEMNSYETVGIRYQEILGAML